MSLSSERKSYIHGRLVSWGDAAAGGIGLPSGCSALMGASGGDYGSRDLWSPAVEEIERAVCLLPEVERKVVRELYVMSDATTEQRCRALCMSSSSLYRYRDKAFERLSATLVEFKKKYFCNG